MFLYSIIFPGNESKFFSLCLLSKALEGQVYNLLYDIPVPSPGRSVRFWCLGEDIMLSMPKTPQELPLYDYNLLHFR